MLSDESREQVSRILTWVLAAALLLSVIGVGYIAVNPPQTTDPYTEFYILGPNGNASGYPTNLTVGESGTVIVGISNHEHQPVTYTVAVVAENRTLATRTVTVANGETWEDAMSFTVDTAGRHKVRFLLYKGRDATLSAEPYHHLRLWVTVSSNRSSAETSRRVAEASSSRTATGQPPSAEAWAFRV